jgi:hypothetical protein
LIAPTQISLKRDMSYGEPVWPKEQEELLYALIQTGIVKARVMMRRLAAIQPVSVCCGAPTNSPPTCKGALDIATLWGDEPLLNAGSGRRHSRYRLPPCHTEAGAPSWRARYNLGSLLGASQALSLFCRQTNHRNSRIPSGKPGKEGSEALQRATAL